MAFTNQILQDEVHAALANRGDLSVAAGSRIERWLNVAQVKIARESFWQDLQTANSDITLLINATSLAYPANFRYQKSMVLKDGDSTKKLIWMDAEEFDKRFPRIHDSSAVLTKNPPVFFTNWAEEWAFWPIPDVQYTINLKKGSWPTDLTTLAQTTDFKQKDDLLILLATADLMDSLGVVDKAVKKYAIFSAHLEQARTEDQRKPGQDIIPQFEAGVAVGDYWRDPFVTKGVF